MRPDLSDPILDDARELLAYWEGRSRGLPRRAVRRRREARAMAVRWRARVADADRSVHGRGPLGALRLVAAEHRLPEPARHAWRVSARRATRAALVLAVTVTVGGAVVLAELLVALLRAPA